MTGRGSKTAVTTRGASGNGSGSGTGDEAVMALLQQIRADMATKADTKQISDDVQRLVVELNAVKEKVVTLEHENAALKQNVEELKKRMTAQNASGSAPSRGDGTSNKQLASSDAPQQRRFGIFAVHEEEMENSRSLEERTVSSMSKAEHILTSVLGICAKSVMVVDAFRAGKAKSAAATTTAGPSTTAASGVTMIRPLVVEMASKHQVQRILQKAAQPDIKQKLHAEKIYLKEWLTGEEAQYKQGLKKHPAFEQMKRQAAAANKKWFFRRTVVWLEGKPWQAQPWDVAPANAAAATPATAGLHERRAHG